MRNNEGSFDAVCKLYGALLFFSQKAPKQKKSAHPGGCKDLGKYNSVVLETKSLRYSFLTPLQNYNFSTSPHTIGGGFSCITL